MFEAAFLHSLYEVLNAVIRYFVEEMDNDPTRPCEDKLGTGARPLVLGDARVGDACVYGSARLRSAGDGRLSSTASQWSQPAGGATRSGA